jgi:hypothetical protein
MGIRGSFGSGVLDGLAGGDVGEEAAGDGGEAL